jgi:hypothetical protein
MVLTNMPTLQAIKVAASVVIAAGCVACGNGSTREIVVEAGTATAAVGAGPFSNADVPAIAAANDRNRPLSPKFFAYKDKPFLGNGRFNGVEKFCIGRDCIHYGVVLINDVKIRCRATQRQESEFPKIVKGAAVKISGLLENIDVRQIGLAEGCSIV